MSAVSKNRLPLGDFFHCLSSQISSEICAWKYCVLMHDFKFQERNNFLISLLYKLGDGECRIHENHLILPVDIHVKTIYIS